MSLAATLAKVAGVRTVFQPEDWHSAPCAAADLAGLSPLAYWQTVHRATEDGLSPYLKRRQRELRAERN